MKAIALITALTLVSTGSALATKPRHPACKYHTNTPLDKLKETIRSLPKIGDKPTIPIALSTSIQAKACRTVCYYLADPNMTLGQAAEELFADYQQDKWLELEGVLPPVKYRLAPDVYAEKYKSTAKLKDFASKNYMPLFTFYIASGTQ